MDNHVTLAVAGSGKTQSIADYCASLSRGRRVLVVTFTQMAQAEVAGRIAKYAGDNPQIEVMGWFAFLLRHFAIPFFPFKFPGQRIHGFNFEGRPNMKAKGLRRFLDSNHAAYKCELARLAFELVGKSRGALVRRLECIYDEIIIDEVQDLSGYDWDILEELLNSSLSIRMVGDTRQAVLSTNFRTQKNKQFSHANAIEWFLKQEEFGVLQIEYEAVTRRCRPEIARFSDTIFESIFPFPKTESLNGEITGHDGVFLVHPNDVPAYVDQYSPQCLRYNVTSGKRYDLDYLNYGEVKGTTYKRVLIVPTVPIEKFIRSGEPLKGRSAAGFYVAVTRAAQSVAVVLATPGESALPYWKPSTP